MRDEFDVNEFLDVRVIIPTHDRPDSLLTAVESVLGQTVQAAEIVVVDDTENQSAVAVVAKFGNRVRVLNNYRTVGPRGAGSSRNAGALGASTTFLAFLDDDDYWEETFLARSGSLLVNSCSDVCIAWGTLVAGGIRIESNWRMPDRVSRRQLLGNNPGVTGSNLMLRRIAFEAIGGFDPALWVYNDLDLFVRLSRAYLRYVVVQENLVVQTADAADHLSSRSDRRSAGIRAYSSKHKAEASARQKLSLFRAARRALMHPNQRRMVYIRSFILVLVTTNPAQMCRAIAFRLAGRSDYS